MSIKIRQFFVSDDGFAGCAYCPENAAETAVIVFTGSDGGLQNAKYIAALFAREGIIALALAYFRHTGLGDTLSLIPLEYIERAARWLKDTVHAKNIALYGASKGAEYALCAAARFSLFECVVAVVPYDRVTEGLGKGLFGAGCSSWTYRGEPLPWLPLARKPGALFLASIKERQMSIRTLYELSEKAGVPDETVIPAEQSTARILLLSSEQDGTWPSGPAAERICARLQRHNYPHAYRHVSFSTVSHVLNPVTPELEKLLRKVTRVEKKFPQTCAQARKEAFALAVDWIKQGD